jgi:hypothetical protein
MSWTLAYFCSRSTAHRRSVAAAPPERALCSTALPPHHPVLACLCTAHAHDPVCALSIAQNSMHARTPASSAMPSRRHCRHRVPEPRRAPPSPQVDHACHADHDRPTPRSIWPPERQNWRSPASPSYAPPREPVSGDQRRHPACPTDPGRPIRDQRVGLDPAYRFA